MKKVEKKKKRSPSDIELMILTGLSGAGKSEALGYFEDSGYYCIDCSHANGTYRFLFA